MPNPAKSGETGVTPALNESQRRVVNFFLLMAEISAEQENANQTHESDGLPVDDAER